MVLSAHDGLGAGYVKRSIDQLPRQGTTAPWLMSTNYRSDLRVLREGSVADANLRFTTSTVEVGRLAPANRLPAQHALCG